ncbi:hypothetical protein [Marinobacter sp.]
MILVSPIVHKLVSLTLKEEA